MLPSPLHTVLAGCALGIYVLAAVANPALCQEQESTFFSTVCVDDAIIVATGSDGDLWASAWGPDDALNAANGDGAGFSPISEESDITVSRITGDRDNLRGVSLAAGSQLGRIWSGSRYNPKPTGMVCAGGVLYLAVQDLNRFDFDDAPAASILRSDDLGRTWHGDRSAPMFKDHVFTTIMFLHYGKNSRNAPDRCVYAYGLDNNWPRNAPDPQANLARLGPGIVPVAKTISAGDSGRLNDGLVSGSADDRDGEDKTQSWWGYTWPRLYTMDTLVFTSGSLSDEGGWFREPPRVQVRKDGRWVEAEGQRVSPEYPGARPEKPFGRYVFRFAPVAADGIRLIGATGGTRTFTSVAELEVYYGWQD